MYTSLRREEEGRPRVSMQALLSLYRACIANARDLLEDARVLLDARRAPRAYALAFTAHEEVGKAQLVADYLSDCVSTKEFEAAFSRHDVKVAYCWRYVELQDNPEFPVLQAAAETDIDALRALLHRHVAVIRYDTSEAKRVLQLRHAALYVGKTEGNGAVEPSSQVNLFMAETMIEEAESLLHDIDHAEWLNGRVGSKGLFK